MLPSQSLIIAIPWIVGLILISGCDDRATRISLEAAERQAQQNAAMAKLNQEVASGARRLVDADAQARQEIVRVHRDLQAERTRLDTGWNVLEQERRQIAAQRRTESMLVPLTKLVGGLLLVVVLLGFCWYAIAAAQRSEATDQLNELLVCEILPDEPPPLSTSRQRPALLGQSPPDEHASE
ncbi:MAG: hypothetical protein WD738_06905 [Pirellulales bacterium]